MLTREDVERITENVIRELKIEVTESTLGSKDDLRIIRLLFRGKIVDEAYLYLPKTEIG